MSRFSLVLLLLISSIELSIQNTNNIFRLSLIGSDSNEIPNEYEPKFINGIGGLDFANLERKSHSNSDSSTKSHSFSDEDRSEYPIYTGKFNRTIKTGITKAGF